MLPDERTTHNNAVTLPAHVEALVVAPDRDVARPLITFLRQEGVDVRVSADLDGAFEEALMYPPDVVMIDESVGGKRGVELCARLKSSVRTHFVPTILMMRDDDAALRLKAISAGVDAIFSPDVDGAERRMRLWSLLRTRALFRRFDRKQRNQGTEINERRRWFAYLLHDLQGAIGALTANVEFLSQFAPAQNDRRRPDFDEAVQDAGLVLDQLLQNVRTVLDFDRFEAGTLSPALSPVRMSDLLREVVADLGRNAGDLELVSTSDDPVLRVDTALMRNALVNMLTHCRKHATGKTKVRVLARRPPQTSVCVEISGVGLRFSETDKLRMFDAYHRLDERPVAYGVGLALARAVVESHGGEIWAENGVTEENTGSFVFSLPTSPEESPGGRSPA